MGFLELVRCWHGSLVGSQRDLVSSLGPHELPTCHWMTCSKKGALSCFHKLHLHEKSRDVDLPATFFDFLEMLRCLTTSPRLTNGHDKPQHLMPLPSPWMSASFAWRGRLVSSAPWSWQEFTLRDMHVDLHLKMI